MLQSQPGVWGSPSVVGKRPPQRRKNAATMADFDSDFKIDRSLHFDKDGELKTPEALIYRPPGGTYPAAEFPDGTPAYAAGNAYRCLWPSENDDEDPEWKRMFMTDTEDDEPPIEMVTQQIPYLKREMVKPRKRKGEAFCDVMKRMTDGLIPEDFEKGIPSYFDAAHRMEKNYLARMARGSKFAATDVELAMLKCLEIFRKVKKQDKSGVEDGIIWISCALYTTAYVDDVRVKPKGAPRKTRADPDFVPADPATVENATLEQE